MEAKGGGGSLGFKKIGGKKQTQGTKNYFEATAKGMSRMRGKAGSVAKELLKAYKEGRSLQKTPAEVVYLYAKTPIEAGPNGKALLQNIAARQFDLRR